VTSLEQVSESTQSIASRNSCKPATGPDVTRKPGGFAAGGQWMYSWFSMTTDRNFFIGFIMIGMKRTYCMKLKFKGTNWTLDIGNFCAFYFSGIHICVHIGI